jgi:hypothetical protein
MQWIVSDDLQAKYLTEIPKNDPLISLISRIQEIELMEILMLQLPHPRLLLSQKDESESRRPSVPLVWHILPPSAFILPPNRLTYRSVNPLLGLAKTLFSVRSSNSTGK